MRITGIFFTACAMFALSACGGGGSSSNNATSPPPAGVSEQGSLTLLIGDGPLDAVDEVNITITEIILLGDDGQQTIFDGEVGPINLLELQNVTVFQLHFLHFLTFRFLLVVFVVCSAVLFLHQRGHLPCI